MIQNKRISLVVPCKNEAGIIRKFIRRVPNYVDEILVIDNNSTDGTANIARKTRARVYREKRNINGIGYGFAHQTGLSKSTGDYIVALDGDDTYPVQSIKTIINYMERYGLDMVSCNRLPLTNPHAISRVRQIGIRLLNAEVHLLYGKRMSDTLTGMWIGRKDVLRSLSPSSGDWNYSPEIKLEAITRKDIRFQEYHIRHFSRIGNQSKQELFRTGIRHAFFILKRRFTTDNPIMAFGRSVRTGIQFGSKEQSI